MPVFPKYDFIEKVMLYKEARDKIKDGDIVFMAKSKGIVAATIRFFTRSVYSHVNIAFWIQTEAGPRLCAVEAQGGTTRRMINMSYYETRADMHIVSCPKDFKTFVAPEALKQLGFVNYSYKEAFYIGLREFLLKYLKIKIKEKTLGEICSEFVARVIGMKDSQLSPDELQTSLEETGFPIILKIEKTV